jgi:pimeloyl-ACP methyl ester carboxylesterase
MSYFDQHGCQIYYEDLGRGEPVILIHGLGSSTQDWEYQVPELQKHFRVIAVDVRGHGRSGKPVEHYSIQTFADDIRALIQHLKLQKPHVVGISMGAMIAFQLAVDHPGLLGSLVIVNSGPEVKARSIKQWLEIAKRRLLSRFLSLEHIGKALASVLFPHPQQEHLRQKIQQRWPLNDKRAYLASLEAIIGWSVYERISSILCPTLVISADKDYTSVVDKEAYVAQIPHAKLLVIEHSRHATPLDQPVRFNQALLNFLNSAK